MTVWVGMTAFARLPVWLAASLIFDRRAEVGPGVGLFEGVGGLEDRFFPLRSADDLQANG